MHERQDTRVSLRRTFAYAARVTRGRLRLTQTQVAEAVGISRGHVAAIETLRANPTLDVVDRMSNALGLEAQLTLRPPLVFDAGPQRDLVHARCSAHVERRLRSAGWQTAREAEIVEGRSHGWIDVLAFHPRSETLLVIEVKTRLDDVGSVERQLGWYGRAAAASARRHGWRPRRIVSWLLALASDEVDLVIHNNGDLMGQSFPTRAREMMAWLMDDHQRAVGRGLALLDPSSKRREWLIRSRLDGRRSRAPFVDYADAVRRLSNVSARTSRVSKTRTPRITSS